MMPWSHRSWLTDSSPWEVTDLSRLIQRRSWAFLLPRPPVPWKLWPRTRWVSGTKEAVRADWPVSISQYLVNKDFFLWLSLILIILIILFLPIQYQITIYFVAELIDEYIFPNYFPDTCGPPYSVSMGLKISDLARGTSPAGAADLHFPDRTCSRPTWEEWWSRGWRAPAAEAPPAGWRTSDAHRTCAQRRQQAASRAAAGPASLAPL